jgi:GNAT superfamily N-acetyltransferase
MVQQDWEVSRHPAPTVTIELRPALPAEAAALTALALRAKASWGYPPEWIAEWRDALTVSPEYIARHRVVKAVEGTRMLGFYALIRQPDGWLLDHLWVEPGAMRSGIGRRLVQHALAAAQRHGGGPVLIESDPNAEGFYLRMGAVRIGAVPVSPAGRGRVLPLLRILP